MNAMSMPGSVSNDCGDTIYCPSSLPTANRVFPLPLASTSASQGDEYLFPYESWSILPPTPGPSVYSPEVLQTSPFQSDFFEAAVTADQNSSSSFTSTSPTLDARCPQYQWRPFIYHQGSKPIHRKTEAETRSERRKEQNRRSQQNYRKRQMERAATYQAQAEANHNEVRRLLSAQHELYATIERLQSEIEALKGRYEFG
jgi:hypothetical protein